MRDLLPVLPRPSRYAGIEDGACRKDPAHLRLHMALAFPDTYEVGMSYLGQKILYGIVNAHEGWWAERVMAPDRETAEILRQHGAPLCTLESDTPLGQLHCLAFSVTHELCYTNVLYMLDLAGIPLRTAERSEDLRACPLIISGGGALLSAEPLAPFLDLMVLGDGEESLCDVLTLLQEALETGLGRTAFLHRARQIAGVYVPSLFTTDARHVAVPLLADYTRPARRIVADLNAAVYPARQVVPVGAVHNRLSLEIARGCTRGCRFCHAGMVYRPARERSLENITALLTDCLQDTGFDEISFLSLSTGDFSALKTLSNSVLDRCTREQISLSLPSLRVGSIDDDIMERMSSLRRTGVTLAPEAGSQRLRDVINKGVSEEGLLLHAQKLLEHGWRMVKLYFMIGLPTETDADLAAIADICRKVRDAADRGGPRLQVTASLSPFVPKPFTPFQWEAQISQAEISRRVNYVRSLFKGQKFLKLRWHEPAMSHLEGVLSRADRRMAQVVEKAYRKGAIFCSWMENFTLEPWLEALRECDISEDELTGARPVGAALPWSHLEAGVSERFLLREREKALRAETTSDCRYEQCHMCGACDKGQSPSLLPHANLDAAGRPVRHENRLVFPQRDQNAHKARRNAEGRLICKIQTKKPPQLATELTVKAVQYRLWHSKMGGCAYLSQLELQAVLERALRRAALPMAFSQGFHPLPLMSFGKALPVGVESRAEWFALTLHSPMPAREVQDKLNPLLPPGMEILSVEEVDKASRTEQALKERFLLGLPTPEACAAARRCFADFAALSHFEHTRQTKKGARTNDLRPLLEDWQAVEAPLAAVPSPACGPARAEELPAVTFTADWTTLYLSPLLLALAILAPLGDEAFLRPRLRLYKTAQIYADGHIYP